MAQYRYNLSNIEAEYREYLSAENQDLSHTSIKNYASDTKYFVGWIGSRQGAESDQDIENLITTDVVKEYIAHLDRLLLPTSTYNRRLSSLRRFLNFLKEREITTARIPDATKKTVLELERKMDIDNTARPYRKMGTAGHDMHRNLRFGPVIGLCVSIAGIYLLLQGSGALFAKNTTPLASLKKSSSGRIFAFNGRLTDRLGNAIGSITPVQFRLYDSASSRSPIYQSGVCSITPDRNGNFSVLVGGAAMSPPPPQDVCGGEVSATLFAEHAMLYLGTTVGSDQEMRPRKQIANVSYSSNTERLQNLSLGSEASSIPYIAPDGSIILSVEAPHIASTAKSGTFTISSSSDVTIQSAQTGDITLNATGSGAIRLKTGGSSSDRIFISDGGNVGINTAHPAAFRLEISGDVGPDLGRVFNLGSATRMWNSLFTDRICFDGSFDCVTSTQGIFNAVDPTDGSKLSVKGDLVSGSSSTSGKTTLDIGGSGTSFALCHSSESGTDNQGIVDCASTPTADFAEMYPTESNTEFGDIVALGSKVIKTTTGDEIRQLIKTSRPYDSTTIGIVSDNFGDFISVGHNISSSDNPLPIALKGRVPVKISPSSSAIQVGDYITTSSDRGKGQKADRDGMVIGRALEPWEPGSVKNKIMVFVGTDMITQTDTPISIISEVVSGILAAPVKLLTAQKVISPQIETSTLTPPSGGDLVVDLKDSSSELVVKGANGQNVTSISNTGDIQSAGTVSAKNGVFSDTVEAQTIKSGTIDLINSNLNTVQQKLTQLTHSSSASPSSLLNSQVFSLISEEALMSHLIVTNEATVASLSVQNAITSLADNLEIASQKTISFFKDAILFTRGGNIVTRGSITANELQIANTEGVSVASVSASGSATFKRLNLPEIAGEAVLPEGENTVIVPFPDLKSSSNVYITPVSEHGYLERPLFIKEKHICTQSEEACVNHFVVAIGTDNHRDISFSWLVIN